MHSAVKSILPDTLHQIADYLADLTAERDRLVRDLVAVTAQRDALRDIRDSSRDESAK